MPSEPEGLSSFARWRFLTQSNELAHSSSTLRHNCVSAGRSVRAGHTSETSATEGLSQAPGATPRFQTEARRWAFRENKNLLRHRDRKASLVSRQAATRSKQSKPGRQMQAIRYSCPVQV